MGNRSAHETTSQHSDVNTTLPSGDTLLTAAVQQGYGDLVLNLLVEGADVNKGNATGSTALHLAARTDQEEIIQILLEYNADVHALDSLGSTPLHIAAQYGSVTCTQMLLKAGAHPDGITADKITCSKSTNHTSYNKTTGDTHIISTGPQPPLFRAIEAENLKAAETLLIGGANIHLIWDHYVDGIVSIMLSETVTTVDLKALKLMIIAKGRVLRSDVRMQTMFRFLSNQGQLELARLLYTSGYQVVHEDLKLIGSAMDKDDWSHHLIDGLPKPEEEEILRFKLWLFEAVNYPMTLVDAAALIIKKDISKNILYGMTQLGSDSPVCKLLTKTVSC